MVSLGGNILTLTVLEATVNWEAALHLTEGPRHPRVTLQTGCANPYGKDSEFNLGCRDGVRSLTPEATAVLTNGRSPPPYFF